MRARNTVNKKTDRDIVSASFFTFIIILFERVSNELRKNHVARCVFHFEGLRNTQHVTNLQPK